MVIWLPCPAESRSGNLEPTNGKGFDDLDPITVKADVLVVKALEQMEHNRRKPISVLPVVNEGHQLMGLLRLHDLVQAGLREGTALVVGAAPTEINSAACTRR